MRVLSLFSGVGGFDMGLEAAGMTTVFQCEIDKHARAVLDHHWPDVPKWDDVSTLTGEYILEHTDGVDVVAWGSPCQDLSLAGKRAGLSGERSGLFHQGIRIIKELRELSNGKYPTWSVWENVVGALSSNGGADFGEVLYEMDEAGACFSEWAVLDAQYFGVPQRRRRVFVISCFDSATSERCGDKILAVEQSGGGDSAKGKQTRKGSAGTVTESIGTGSPLMVIDGRRTNDVRVTTEPVYTLEARMGTGGNNVPFIAQETTHDVCGTLQARSYKGPNHENARDGQLVIQHQDGREMKKKQNGMGVGEEGDPSYTLNQTGAQAVAQGPIIFEPGALSRVDGKRWSMDVSHTLRAEMGDNHPAVVTEPTMQVRRLTPIECERLMGWPDNHTAIGTNGPVSDTNRYKMCGNGVASPVAQWIGEHLMRITDSRSDSE